MCDLRNSKLKQGSYFILEDVGHCKSKHYMQNTSFVIMTIIKVSALDTMMSLRKVTYIYMICGNIKIKLRAILYVRKWGLL